MNGNAFTLSVLFFLIASYLGQRFLPAPKPKLLGIDLGTTFSCVGVYYPSTGVIEVIPDRSEDATFQCIPSVVAFIDENEIIVGYDAIQYLSSNPRATIYDTKRFIGKSFTEEEITQGRSRYPFEIRLNETNHVVFEVELNNGNVIQVSPETVGGHIVRHLRSNAEAHLGKTYSSAVMAVPADFDKLQRAATISAGNNAGLEIYRLITEPTAAALAYGMHEIPNVRTVIVLDIGGGTTDASLLELLAGTFITIGIAGNNLLGGQDFNERLLSSIQANHPDFVDFSSKDAVFKLKRLVDACKITLTNVTECQLGSQTGNITVTRKQFEEVNKDLFEATLAPIKTLLQEHRLKSSDVDEIVLVGGSTRIPAIQRLIADLFADQTLHDGTDPELAVVSGIAVQAGIIAGTWPVKVQMIESPSVRLKKIQINHQAELS